MQDKKYTLVTGGAGYIGSHTVVAMIENGMTPIIIDDFRNAQRAMLDGIREIAGTDIICLELDACDKVAMKKVFEQYPIDGIIHFAAYKAVGESVERPLMYYSNNLQSLVVMLELSEEFGVENFVFSSSCTVYGEPDGIAEVSESTPTKEANSPYGATKQISEQILTDVLASGSRIKVLKLRYFNPVGAHPSGKIGEVPQGRPNNLLPYVTQTAVGVLECLTVFGNDYNTGDGTCIRDYIHVMDLAEAHVKGLQWLHTQSAPKEEIVNLGTGKGTSVLEIIHTFEKVSGLELNWKFGDRRPGDVEQIFANVDKAKNVLGWEASRNIEDAIRDAWNWEQNWRND